MAKKLTVKHFNLTDADKRAERYAGQITRAVTPCGDRVKAEDLYDCLRDAWLAGYRAALSGAGRLS